MKKIGDGAAGPDDLEKVLTAMPSAIPPPRLFTSKTELLALIQSCGGPRTARSIRGALKHAKASRIPHLFSTIDTQVVVDILANDLDTLIKELIEGHPP